ncbi:MFS transporter [Brevibacillus centrosporus]|jgi:SHS family lactate transporter-like MFS transporter|uniref:MFS transporter n=1 Tax=Brevibacillus centrosporus TaxID=54910 RepID=UPI000F09A934|nr:MFS transporter [Brevibacillus centrosporus]MEC2129041.1 MFS transporter [Brevibacillus centrosporus]MED1949574.1 MFS transporter [Brevibacillus centrosporus]RNB70597.1 MFS transporter [Brevibacillus centrosporus]GED29269.1 MFS transporter [Brevibacillus centrosporus]
MGFGADTSLKLNATSVYTRNETLLVVFFAFLGALFDGIELNLISYPMVYISKSLGVTTADMVTVLTWQGLASLVGGFLFGWLGDVIGRRWSYALCVLIYGVGAILAAFIHSYDVFLITRIFAGIGIGGQFGLVFTMFTECWKTEKRGTMGGLIQSMFVVGQIVTVIVTYFCLQAFGADEGWRDAFLILGVLSVIVGVASIFYLPESKLWLEYREKLRAGTLPVELKRTGVPLVDIFKNGLAYGTTMFMIVSTAVFIISYQTITYQSTFLLKEAGVPLNLTSVIVLIALFITGIAYVIVGYISDKLNRKWAFFWGAVVGLIGFGSFLILALTGNIAIGENFLSSPMFWSLMICNAGYAGFAVLGVWMSEFFPTRLRATGNNVCYYVGRGLGAGLFPLIAIKIAGSVTMALALGIIGAIAAVVFALFAADRTGREINAIE